MRTPDEYNCKTCIDRYCDTDRKMPGSLGPASFPMFVVDDPAGGVAPLVESRTCLLPMIDARIWFLFRLYKHYENGVLYQAGGLMEQPSQYIELMEIIREALQHGRS